MKKVINIICLVIALVFLSTGCTKNENYNDYIGYQYSGTDPWGNKVAVTIRTLLDGNLTWTYTDVIDNGINSALIYSENRSELTNGTTSEVNMSGDTDVDEYKFDYVVTLTLKDGNVKITYLEGAVESISSEGGSASHQVGPLEEKDRTITLTKIVDVIES